ncbi:MAG TPA: WD40 repeat domain-containing protein [Blastocatellia bacterium]|nr:WD40 repeat domain-containing protein [Blastocatellia bacterium]
MLNRALSQFLFIVFLLAFQATAFTQSVTIDGQHNQAIGFTARLVSTFGKRSNIAFSPDGNRVALYAVGQVKINNARDNSPQTSFSIQGKEPIELIWSSDGQRLAVLSSKAKNQPAQIKIWDAKAGNVISTLNQIRDDIGIPEFSNDSSKLLTVSFSKRAQAWEVVTGKLIADFAPPKDSRGRWWDLQWSSDGRQLLMTSYGSEKSFLWETETGKLKATLEHPAPDEPNSLLESILVLLITRNPTAVMWTTPLPMTRGFFANNDQTVVTITKTSSSIQIWDAETGLLLPSQRPGKEIVGRLTQLNNPGLFYSPDGEIIAELSYDYREKVKLLDSQLKLKAKLPVNGCVPDRYFGEKGCEPILFHPSSKIVLTQSYGKVQLWSTKDGSLIALLDKARHPAKFSPDGRWLATQSKDYGAMLWEIIEK